MVHAPFEHLAGGPLVVSGDELIGVVHGCWVYSKPKCTGIDVSLILLATIVYFGLLTAKIY